MRFCGQPIARPSAAAVPLYVGANLAEGPGTDVEAVINNERLSGWNADLSGAFGILLGAPLDAFDPTATYAFYHWDEFLDAEFYRGLDLADLLSAEVQRPSDLAEPWHPAFRHSDDGSEMSWTRFGFDLGRSVFRVDEEMLRGDVDDDIAGFSGDVITALEAAATAPDGTGWRAIAGTAFGGILARHGVNLADLAKVEGDYATCGVSLLARVQTDGSLFDAMRAATWTMGGPDRLAPFIDPAADDEYGIIDRLPAQDAVVVEPEWEQALRNIDHTPLRDHLRSLCLSRYWAASHGGCYDGSQISNEFACLAGQGHRPVAGWHFGHAQAASAIFQLR